MLARIKADRLSMRAGVRLIWSRANSRSPCIRVGLFGSSLFSPVAAVADASLNLVLDGASPLGQDVRQFGVSEVVSVAVSPFAGSGMKPSTAVCALRRHHRKLLCRQSGSKPDPTMVSAYPGLRSPEGECAPSPSSKVGSARHLGPAHQHSGVLQVSSRLPRQHRSIVIDALAMR